MPRTDQDQVFRDGVLQSTTPRVVDDATIEREQAPNRLRQSFNTLRTWAVDEAATNTAWPTLTNAQKDAANRMMHQRFSRVCDGLADLLQHLTVDRE